MSNTVKIKQIKSAVSRTKDQGATLKALGLRRINDTAEVPARPEIMGMIYKVRHLVEIQQEGS